MGPYEILVGPVRLVASTRTAEFRLANPWPGHAVKVAVSGKARILPAKDVLSIRLRRGESASLTPGQAAGERRSDV